MGSRRPSSRRWRRGSSGTTRQTPYASTRPVRAARASSLDRRTPPREDASCLVEDAFPLELELAAMEPLERPTPDTTRRPGTLTEFRLAGETLLEQGAPLVAYDVLAEGLDRFPTDVRLRQLHALALART